jgi:hypothetical protein
MNDQLAVGDGDDPRVREPSLLDAIIPVVTLISLIGLTTWLFGTDATGGPLQISILTSARVAGSCRSSTASPASGSSTSRRLTRLLRPSRTARRVPSPSKEDRHER